MNLEGKTVLLPLEVGTSGRRWEAWGPARTVLRMWRLRIGYLLGMTAEQCAERYRRGPSRSPVADDGLPRQEQRGEGIDEVRVTGTTLAAKPYRPLLTQGTSIR